LRDIEESRLVRWSTELPELDFVLGGGIVPGSMTLVGGEPGIGKSTLLLQAAARLEAGGRSVLYASGEESVEQLRLRADRLEEDAGPVHVVGETSLEGVIDASTRVGADILILDSIQTVYTEQLESAPGNVGQVRECAARLMRFAKESGAAIVLGLRITHDPTQDPEGGIVATSAVLSTVRPPITACCGDKEPLRLGGRDRGLSMTTTG
jgi:DNA repair protein RadA/Sms